MADRGLKLTLLSKESPLRDSGLIFSEIARLPCLGPQERGGTLQMADRGLKLKLLSKESPLRDSGLIFLEITSGSLVRERQSVRAPSLPVPGCPGRISTFGKSRLGSQERGVPYKWLIEASN